MIADNCFEQLTVKFPSIFIILVLVIVGVVGTIGVMQITANSHAIERHGTSTIDNAINCFDKNGSALRMYNPETKRKADICFDKMFYIHITNEQGDTITIFSKEKMKLLEQVIQYLKNVGYK